MDPVRRSLVSYRAELTLLFVRARNKAWARQKGWGPWSKYSEFADMEKFHTVSEKNADDCFNSKPARSPMPRDRPLPARPARFSAPLPHMSLHCLDTSSSIYGSLEIEGQTQHKKVCTILLYLNRSEIIPFIRKICSEELIFSACTRHYFNRKRKLVA
jgi:hypothetical protein